jgi:hypothetical protein
MAVTLNASTSSGFIQTADTSGTLQIQSNGTTQFTVDSTGAYGQLERGTAVASTSGTSIDFTGLPSWVKRVTVVYSGVSLNGSSNLLIQLGDSGGIETTGYVSTSVTTDSSGGSAGASSTSGLVIWQADASLATQGIATIVNITGNTWVFTQTGRLPASNVTTSGGDKTLSTTLDRVRITTVNGTDTFDAGTINILYEG